MTLNASSTIGDINREFEEREAQNKANSLGLEYVDIAAFPLNPDVLRLIDEEQALKAELLPFYKKAKHLKLAVIDPNKGETKALIKDLEKQHYTTETLICSRSGFVQVTPWYQSNLIKRKTIELRNAFNESDKATFESAFLGFGNLAEQLYHMTSPEALNEIEIAALKVRASDIHLQPLSNKVVLRFRLDGVLYDICDIEMETAKKLINHIKYQGGMKSNVSHVPQDGHLSFTVNERSVDLRVSTIPTEFVESVVMRVLDSRKGIKTFTELGFDALVEDKITRALRQRSGMILVTGPTGSGKTTTLYSMLAELNTSERKLVTLEDPIEYHLDNVTQSQVASNSDYNFANGLKAILRHDPDVVLIGEIREMNTAKLTAEAALTGHVVFSSLHTNSSVGAITRLRNLGMESFNIASALNTVLAQRLVRKICPHCSTEVREEVYGFARFKVALERVRSIYPQLKAKLDTEWLPIKNSEDKARHDFLTAHKGAGCEKCSHTGFLGQTVITEVLQMDDALRDLISQEARELEISAAVRSQDPRFLSLYEDGVRKVLKGETTLDEVLRVVG